MIALWRNREFGIGPVMAQQHRKVICASQWFYLIPQLWAMGMYLRMQPTTVWILANRPFEIPHMRTDNCKLYIKTLKAIVPV